MNINGDEVTITTRLIQGKENSLKAQRRNYSSKAPVGNSSDYTKLISTLEKDITFDKYIEFIAETTLISAIVAACAITGVTAALIPLATEGLKLYLTRNNIKSKSCTIKMQTYQHRTKGFNVAPGVSTEMKKITYYAFSNYTGRIGTDAFWEVYKY